MAKVDVASNTTLETVISTLEQQNELLETISADGIPAGGTTGQVLKKASSNYRDLIWADDETTVDNYIPDGGTINQILIKQSSTNYDASWNDNTDINTYTAGGAINTDSEKIIVPNTYSHYKYYVISDYNCSSATVYFKIQDSNENNITINTNYKLIDADNRFYVYKNSNYYQISCNDIDTSFIVELIIDNTTIYIITETV